jgi:hypothetical protein
MYLASRAVVDPAARTDNSYDTATGCRGQMEGGFFMYKVKLQTTPELLASWLEKCTVRDDRIELMRPRPRESYRPLGLWTVHEIHPASVEKIYLGEGTLSRSNEYRPGDDLWVVYEVYPVATGWKEEYPQEEVPLFISIGSALLSHNPSLTEVEGRYLTLPGLMDLVELGQYCLDSIRNGMLETFGALEQAKQKGGRRRNLDDEWARQQVWGLGRDRAEVFNEWRERIGNRLEHLADSRDSFNKALKKKLGEKMD